MKRIECNTCELRLSDYVKLTSYKSLWKQLGQAHFRYPVLISHNHKKIPKYILIYQEYFQIFR